MFTPVSLYPKAIVWLFLCYGSPHCDNAQPIFSIEPKYIDKLNTRVIILLLYDHSGIYVMT